jgi:hypothetical protein
MRTEEALSIILLATVLLRLIPFGFWGFVGSDPYVHLGVAKHLEKSGFIDYPLSNFPSGHRITEPIGMYLTPLLIYHTIPSTIEVVFQLTPVIFACISIVISYFLFKEILDRRTALITCSLLAISTANITRTAVGTYRGEMLFIPFFLTALIFLVRSKDDWKLAGFSGSFAGTSSYFWNGYPFAIVTIAAFYFLAICWLYLRKKNFQRVLKSFILFSVVCLIAVNIGYLSNIVPMRNVFTDLYFPSFVAVTILVFMVGNIFERRREYLSIAMIVATLITFIAFPNMFLQVSTGFGLVVPQDNYNLSIEELQTPTLEFLYLTLDATVFLSLFGIFALGLKFLQEKDWNRSILLVLFATSLYIALASTRFIFLASYVFAAVSAFYISEAISKDKMKGYALALVVFSIMFYHSYSIRTQMQSDLRWEPSLNHILERTPTDSGFVVWRDAGGIIQAFGERATVVDSVYGQNMTTLQEFVRFMFNETYDFPGDYAVVDKQQLTQLPAMVSMVGTDYDATLQVLDFYQQGNFVYTSPTEFVIDLVNRNATLNGIGIDLLVFEFSETVLYSSDEPKVPGCLYVQNSGVVYLSQEICDSNFLKLAFLDGLEGLNLTYRDSYISIYEL